MHKKLYIIYLYIIYFKNDMYLFTEKHICIEHFMYDLFIYWLTFFRILISAFIFVIHHYWLLLALQKHKGPLFVRKYVYVVYTDLSIVLCIFSARTRRNTRWRNKAIGVMLWLRSTVRRVLFKHESGLIIQMNYSIRYFFLSQCDDC